MSGELHGFAQACLQLYKDKPVEINTGEQKTKLLLADFEHEQKSLIRGTIRDAFGDGLLVECKIGKNTKKILINVWQIISVAEIDDNGSMKDIYVDEEFRNRRV